MALQASSFTGTPLATITSHVRQTARYQTAPCALFGKKKADTSSSKAQPKQRSQSVLEALDFSKVRSNEDAKLLYEAKYGKRGADGKMTREQYQALRRKVGGTARDYWKSFVDVEGDYVEKGYVGRQRDINESVPGLPILIGIVVLLFGTLGYVISQTS